MAIKQLSIFLENRVGRLAAVAKALGDAGINIRGLSVADTKDFGILRLIVDDVVTAEKVLRSHDTVCQINEVTAVEVDNHPGGLAKVLVALNEAKVNVEYMYAIAEPKGERPVMIFRFSDAKDAARAALRQIGAHLYEEEDLLGK
ncbi:MAG: ACT domain-containing protein [Lentisphaerae bacterium]|jgi:hypothetical protein|nr:ACT domain-containing protein [Lentisphaerota bacterium]